MNDFSPLVVFLLLLSLPDYASAMVIYQDLHLMPTYLKAHGIMMGLAFVIFFPVGAILIRIVDHKSTIWLHAACQMIGWVLMIAGLATGIRIGKIIDILHKNTHTILGTVVVVALLFQPFLGIIHHRRYLAVQKRTAWTYVHVWYGRILILLGIINGGLGLQLAANTMAGKIAYSVLGGIMGALLCAVAVLFETKKLVKQKEKDKEVATQDQTT